MLSSSCHALLCCAWWNRHIYPSAVHWRGEMRIREFGAFTWTPSGCQNWSPTLPSNPGLLRVSTSFFCVGLSGFFFCWYVARFAAIAVRKLFRCFQAFGCCVGVCPHLVRHSVVVVAVSNSQLATCTCSLGTIAVHSRGYCLLAAYLAGVSIRLFESLEPGSVGLILGSVRLCTGELCSCLGRPGVLTVGASVILLSPCLAKKQNVAT